MKNPGIFKESDRRLYVLPDSSHAAQIAEYRSQIEAIDGGKLYYVAHRIKSVELQKSLGRSIADLTGEVLQRQTALHVLEKDIQLSDQKN